MVYITLCFDFLQFSKLERFFLKSPTSTKEKRKFPSFPIRVGYEKGINPFRIGPGHPSFPEPREH
jgi:hypothetical protein